MAATAGSAEVAQGGVHSMRAKRLQQLNEIIAGRDLVETTISTPHEILMSNALRNAVLGRACYPRDEEAMVRRITDNRVRNRDYLIGDATDLENGRFPGILLDAWKLIICDVRFIDESHGLEAAYNAQLREQDLQTLGERAREIVRTEEERLARRNARWFISALENLSPEKFEQMEPDVNATMTIWKEVSPAPPAWIQQITGAMQPWGFAFYKTKKVEQIYGSNWAEAWEAIREQSCVLPHSNWDERSIRHASLDGIHCGGYRSVVKKLWTEDWPSGPPAGGVTSDIAVREHFRGYKESLPSPGILRNTFIVVDAEPIPDSLDEVIHNRLPDLWVWAYDADWDPSLSPTVSVLEGEEYQGRVKVSIYCLNAWFYAARYEGISLLDMWLKAQRHSQKQWICYSKPLEEWCHESYI